MKHHLKEKTTNSAPPKPRTRHKKSMDLPLVGRESLFDNGFIIISEMVTWMEDASCVQPHVH